MRSTPWRAVGLAALVVLLAGGCSAAAGGDRAAPPSSSAASASPTPTSTPTPTPAPTAPAVAAPFHADVGTCLDVRKDRMTGPESIVPCSEPHDDEVYATFELAGDAYPGEASVLAAAEARCADEFTAFIGVAPEASTLANYATTPSEQTWTALGDRRVSCLVWYPEDVVVGSLAGSGR